MHIAIIGCKGIPAATAQGGGVETHVEALALGLVEKGHHVTVYVRGYANPGHRVSWKGIRLVELPSLHVKNLDTITHSFFASIHALCYPCDIIHYHGVGPSTLAWIPRLFRPDKKVVVTFHSRDRFHEKWSWFARMYLAYGEWTAVAFPHVTIAVSHVIQLFCQKMFGAKRVKHIPNGVTIPSLHPGSHLLARLRLKPNQYFFTLSRFVTHKAIDDVIRAYAEVKTSKKLVVIGYATYDDIEYEQMLQKLAAKDPRVLFVGKQQGLALQQLIANGYAMVHASRSEGLSVAILESMSYAKAVIMSDIPENLEVIDHSGIAFHLGNVDALRDVLQMAEDDPTMIEERGLRAREVVKILYSWQSVIDRTEQLYKNLLSV